MRKGTFSVQKASGNSTAHNSRKNPPKYLIGLSENTQNFYEQIQSDDDFIAEAQNIYKDKIGQNMQKKQIANLVQETVLTLQEHQDEDDVKRLFEKLHDKFGGHTLLEVSVHRDEGYFQKGHIAYYPTKDILKKDDAWFIKSDIESELFDTKVDINDFEKVYNYHAHAKFSMFDKETGKTARMQKKDMSERIKFVSDELGLKYEPDSKTRFVSKSVHQVKDEHHARAKAQIQQEQYSYKEYQAKITALTDLTNEQKKELHKLNSQVNKQNADISELNKALQATKPLQDELRYVKRALEVSEYTNGLLNDKIQELEATASVSDRENQVITPENTLETPKSVLSDLDKIVDDSLTQKQVKTGAFKSETVTVVDEAKLKADLKSYHQGLIRKYQEQFKEAIHKAKEFISAKFQKQIEALKKEKQSLRVDVAEQKGLVDGLSISNADLRKEVRELKKEIKSTYEKIDKEATEAVQAQIDSLEDESLRYYNSLSPQEQRRYFAESYYEYIKDEVGKTKYSKAEKLFSKLDDNEYLEAFVKRTKEAHRVTEQLKVNSREDVVKSDKKPDEAQQGDTAKKKRQFVNER